MECLKLKKICLIESTYVCNHFSYFLLNLYSKFDQFSSITACKKELVVISRRFVKIEKFFEQFRSRKYGAPERLRERANKFRANEPRACHFADTSGVAHRVIGGFRVRELACLFPPTCLFIILFSPREHSRPGPHSKMPVQFYSPCVARCTPEWLNGGCNKRLSTRRIRRQAVLFHCFLCRNRA